MERASTLVYLCLLIVCVGFVTSSSYESFWEKRAKQAASRQINPDILREIFWRNQKSLIGMAPMMKWRHKGNAYEKRSEPEMDEEKRQFEGALFIPN